MPRQRTNPIVPSVSPSLRFLSGSQNLRLPVVLLILLTLPVANSNLDSPSSPHAPLLLPSRNPNDPIPPPFGPPTMSAAAAPAAAVGSGKELANPPTDGISNLRFSNHSDHLLVSSWDKVSDDARPSPFLAVLVARK